MRTALVAFCILITVLSFSVISSCKQEKAINPASCSLKARTFVNDILPIVQTNCAIGQCHVSGGLAPYIATDYNQIMPYAANGSLVKAIKHEGAIKMPRIDPNDPLNTTAKKLADSLIQEIECWVLQGYPNN
ncbi:MAG: hypothetical protein ACHQF2_06500 [Flavobacteriales bacterium]